MPQVMLALITLLLPQLIITAVAGDISPTTQHPPKRFVLTEETPVPFRCSSTLGTWCKGFHEQNPVPWKPAPRGSKTCPKQCSGVGNCNYDTGKCECPAGWQGEDCGTRHLRPCTANHRQCHTANQPIMGHIDKDGRDLNLLAGGSTQSRCSGICDPDIAMCWCDGPKGRINAPEGSPPGSPPLRRGRPMTTPMCQLKETKDGKKVDWGEQPYAHIYGPNGWCVADNPVWTCPCIIDGLDGPTCEEVVEAFCVNQCSGHGTCNLGFCKCDAGWYGTDCSRKVAGSELEPSRISQQPWLKSVVREPLAAQEPPPKPRRKRPLVYIYDLEPLYNSKMLQYRIPSSWCVHRRYVSGNTSRDMDLWVYAVDALFHEMLSQSEHRTFDSAEADFFYVPQYSSCMPFPIMGWADYPWFGPPGSGLRVNHAAMMVVEVHKWISENYPFWNRTGGKDHIWLFTHDEGSCWAPTAVNASIWLTHWGRLGPHKSHSAYLGDNYSQDTKCPVTQPEGWLKFIQGHPCYNPDKDLVVPSFKSPAHYRASPLAGNLPQERDILLFFKGDVGKARLPQYSRGIRQKLYKMAIDNDWKKKYNVLIGDGRDVPGDYTELLARSKFCLVAPGDGWSARMEDASLHGCIPVIIMDNVHAVFETILDFSKFSIRVSQDEIPNIIRILQAVTEQQLRAMQIQLSRVWHRFRWSAAPAQYNPAKQMLDGNLARIDELRRQRAAKQGAGTRVLHTQQDDHMPHPHAKLPRPFRGDVGVDDAFATVMQWLYSRIPHTRTPPA